MVLSSLEEERRLRVLRSYRVLDSSPEEAFDNIARLASDVCSTPLALISLVDDARQWFKARVGMPLTQTPRELAFCAHALAKPEAMVVDDACADPRFASNALVTGDPFIRFYAGVPLVSPEGCVLGTLCVLDRVARSLSERELRILERLARQVENELELRRGLSSLREVAARDGAEPPGSSRVRRVETDPDPASLLAELERAQRERDMLVALTVHDLKGPLMSIMINAGLLASAQPTPERADEIVNDIEASAASMQRRVLDLLDIARSRHCALVPAVAEHDVGTLFGDVLRAMRSRTLLKNQTVCVDPASEPVSVVADADLVRRVLENLVDNSLKYTREGSRVVLCARRVPAAVELSVADDGPGIPESERRRIFDVFAQLDLGEATSRLGHGLGLAFCKQAIEAHRGRLWVEPNTPSGSRFCVALPAP